MSSSKQEKGFMIVRKTDELFGKYMEGGLVAENIEYCKALRDTFSFVNPKSYRGVSREPLTPWSSDDDKVLSNDNIPVNIKVRKKFLEVNGQDRNIFDYDEDGWDYNKELIASFNDAIEIYSMLDNPAGYEIIEVVRFNWGTECDFLGFDIGYWGSDHFSLISDLVIMPQWHPAAPEDFDELKKHFLSLNEYCLFPNAQVAEDFKNYYLSKSWSESEEYCDEFCIIQISRMWQPDE